MSPILTLEELNQSILAYDPDSEKQLYPTAETPNVEGYWFRNWISPSGKLAPTVEQLETIRDQLNEKGVFQTEETALIAFVNLSKTTCFQKVIASQTVDARIMTMAQTAIAAVLASLVTKDPEFSAMAEAAWAQFVAFSKANDDITGITQEDRDAFNAQAEADNVPAYIRS